MIGTATATRRAAIYVRISQDRGGGGLGVKRQEQDARQLCERSGWDVVEVFSDNDISAFSGKARPGYRALLDALAAGHVDAVVAWHPDRLHRSPTELEGFINAVETAQAEVATVTAGELDLASANGRMIARIAGAVARHESEHKSERIRRKHVELAEAGKVPGGGQRPFGYEKDRKSIRPDEAELIRDAAARILAGDSLRSIVLDWQSSGVPTVTGASWSPTTVKRLLMSGRISGQREHHGEIVSTAEWPAIITAEQTARLRALLSDQRRNRLAGVDARSYLLSGLVYCGRCKARMTARASHYRDRKAPRYVCSSDRGGCGRCGIHAVLLEEWISAAIVELLDTPKMAKAIARRQRAASRRGPDPTAELREVDARRSELAAMFAARDIGAAEWKAARAALDADQTRLQALVVDATVAAQSTPDPGALRALWADESLTLERRRTVLGQLIERIEIGPTTRGNNKFDPTRLLPENGGRIVWRV